MLHRHKVDPAHAIAVTADLRRQWYEARQFPNCPPFTGGVLDSWPAIAVDGFAVLNDEMVLINAHIREEAERAEKARAAKEPRPKERSIG